MYHWTCINPLWYNYNTNQTIVSLIYSNPRLNRNHNDDTRKIFRIEGKLYRNSHGIAIAPRESLRTAVPHKITQKMSKLLFLKDSNWCDSQISYFWIFVITGRKIALSSGSEKIKVFFFCLLEKTHRKKEENKTNIM